MILITIVLFFIFLFYHLSLCSIDSIFPSLFCICFHYSFHRSNIFFFSYPALPVLLLVLLLLSRFALVAADARACGVEAGEGDFALDNAKDEGDRGEEGGEVEEEEGEEEGGEEEEEEIEKRCCC